MWLRMQVFVVVVWSLIIVGWVSNIVELVHMINDPVTGLFILKVAGCVLFPLGAACGIVGWF